HFAYKLTQYNRDKRQLWEITAHSGISISFLNEEQILTVIEKQKYPGSDYDYHIDKRAFYDFKKTAASVFVNLQLALHVTKYFSFIMADITQNFGVLNPTIPQTTVVSA